MKSSKTTEQENLRQQVIVGVSWTTAALVGKQVLQFIISVILARLLTPQEFGLMGMTLVFTNFALLFGELGFGAALIQKGTVDERHYSSIFWLNMIMGLILTALIMISAPSIAAFYDEPRLESLTRLIAFSFLINPLKMVQAARLSRAMDFRSIALVELVAMIVAGLVAIVLATAGYGIWSLAWQALALAGATVVVMWRVSDWRPRWLFDLSTVAELLGFSGNLMGFQVFNYWTRNVDNLLVGKFIGTTELGIYTHAYTIMLLPLRQVSQVLTRVMFPALSRVQHDKARVKRIYLRALAMIALVTFPMMMGLLSVSEHFVLALYGPKWSMVTEVLQILCVVGMVQSVVITVGWIYQSQGRTDWMFRWGIFAGGVGIASFAIGTYIGTVEAVALCYAIANGFLLYWNFAIPGKLVGMTFGDVIRSVAGILGCALGMAATVWGLGLVLPSTWSHWTYLAVQVPLGGIIYLLFVHLFKVKAYQDLRTLVLTQWHQRKGQIMSAVAKS